jgi:hypothetical protein
MDTYTMRHLAKPFSWVKDKAPVVKGEKIATGLWNLSGENHIHLEVKKNGKKIDPHDVIPYGDMYEPTGVKRPEAAGATERTETGPGAAGASPAASGGVGVSTSVSGAPGAAGGVQVSFTITDRTSGGVSVSQAAKNHGTRARQASPGDLPSLHKDLG